MSVGTSDGRAVGSRVGKFVGSAEGSRVGTNVGSGVGGAVKRVDTQTGSPLPPREGAVKVTVAFVEA